jgi:UDP-N-acetylglucosamine 2-epimerase (non-hydrolysing)
VQKKKILFVFGTRPEAIKICPVVRCFQREDRFEVAVCVTAQHRELLDQVLSIFEVVPDYDLNAMRPGQSVTEVTARILSSLDEVLRQAKPDMVVVHGDTTTALCGALAAFYAGIPVAHVEAGLRTGDLRQPFPEEMNRVVVGRLARLHLAATDGARRNLVRENVARDSIFVTGNSVIDAVLDVRDRLASGALPGSDLRWIDPNRRLIAVTAHRRESFGEGFDRICEALHRLADRPDVQIVFPVHPNPNVTGPVEQHLKGHANIRLIKPLDYVAFVDLMRHAHILLTDSGGIQEEGPSLGKPVLVMREKTERPEAVEAGTVELVGTHVERIVDRVLRLFDSAVYAERARIHNPYGDGRASQRIAGAVAAFFEGRPMPEETMFHSTQTFR